MDLGCCHFGLWTTSLAAARDFYVGKLGLAVLQEMPAIKLLAVRAGDVRISIFEGEVTPSGTPAANFILRTGDLDATIRRLEARGVVAEGGIREAPGFMRYILIRDPDGHPVEIAEYLRDPLAAV